MCALLLTEAWCVKSDHGCVCPLVASALSHCCSFCSILFPVLLSPVRQTCWLACDSRTVDQSLLLNFCCGFCLFVFELYCFPGIVFLVITEMLKRRNIGKQGSKTGYALNEAVWDLRCFARHFHWILTWNKRFVFSNLNNFWHYLQVQKYTTTVLSAMMAGMDDKDDLDDDITLEAMSGLSRVLAEIDESHIRAILINISLRIRPCFEKVWQPIRGRFLPENVLGRAAERSHVCVVVVAVILCGRPPDPSLAKTAHPSNHWRCRCDGWSTSFCAEWAFTSFWKWIRSQSTSCVMRETDLSRSFTWPWFLRLWSLHFIVVPMSQTGAIKVNDIHLYSRRIKPGCVQPPLLCSETCRVSETDRPSLRSWSKYTRI